MSGWDHERRRRETEPRTLELEGSLRIRGSKRLTSRQKRQKNQETLERNGEKKPNSRAGFRKKQRKGAEKKKGRKEPKIFRRSAQQQKKAASTEGGTAKYTAGGKLEEKDRGPVLPKKKKAENLCPVSTRSVAEPIFFVKPPPQPSKQKKQGPGERRRERKLN